MNGKRTLPIASNDFSRLSAEFGFARHFSDEGHSHGPGDGRASHPTRRPPPVGAHSSAFTILELLVAMALLLITLTLLVAVVSSVTDLSSQASSRLDAMRLGREVFDLMQKDLTQAASTVPFRGTNSPVQFLINPGNLSAADNHPTSFFWQAPVARDRSAGDLAVVGYFVQRIGTNQSQLRRVFVEPGDTGNYHVYSTNTAWINPDLISQFSSSANPLTATNLDPGWVADGIMGLWVRCLDGRGNVITEDGTGNAAGWTFDSKLGFRSGSGADAIVRSGIDALPAFVDVGIVCVGARDVSLVDNVPAIPAGSPLTFDADVQAYLSTFSSANPRVKTALALTRRFRISRGSTP